MSSKKTVWKDKYDVDSPDWDDVTFGDEIEQIDERFVQKIHRAEKKLKRPPKKPNGKSE